MAGDYKNHPLADKFPMMPRAELDALKADILENGVREAICLYGGMILDVCPMLKT